MQTNQLDQDMNWSPNTDVILTGDIDKFLNGNILFPLDVS